MITKKSEDAVSPVIGIMLLVVVTVIIAAVITAFATGVVGSTEPAPVAALDVEILSSVEALEGLNGPELFITHLSGDAIDTKDIELRFSWTHNGDSYYSTYSADVFKEKYPTGDIYTGRLQPLYVKSTMKHDRKEYGSGGIDHYFGDVTLTPGLKLTATSEFLGGYENTGSPFMDLVFNNYQIGTTCDEDNIYEGPMVAKPEPNPANHDTECDTCRAGHPCRGTTLDAGVCLYCAGMGNTHQSTECTVNCPCASPADLYGYSGGIMDHLPAGTAVDVMIVHIPSGKAIYDKTVIVQ